MSGAADHAAGAASPAVLVYAVRERARTFARTAFARRHGVATLARSRSDVEAALRSALIDAVIVDVGGGDEAWEIVARAADFPSTPFLALLPYRGDDAPAAARAAASGVADILHDGVDEGVARELVAAHGYSARFLRALEEPPSALRLDTPMQRRGWRAIVERAGRPVTTSELATALGVTREHLSRNFARGGAPNLKRVIDLVRLISAAELSKNPGYDVRDVAAVLGFASSSHLAVAASRIASTRPASLASLRTVDLIDRFTHGRTRSRVAAPSRL